MLRREALGDELWLEVSHVELEMSDDVTTNDKVFVRLRSDKTDEPAPYWRVIGLNRDNYKTIREAIDKKQTIHARLQAKKETVKKKQKLRVKVQELANGPETTVDAELEVEQESAVLRCTGLRIGTPCIGNS